MTIPAYLCGMTLLCVVPGTILASLADRFRERTASFEMTAGLLLIAGLSSLGVALGLVFGHPLSRLAAAF